jgi:hypothetical protein
VVPSKVSGLNILETDMPVWSWSWISKLKYGSQLLICSYGASGDCSSRTRDHGRGDETFIIATQLLENLPSFKANIYRLHGMQKHNPALEYLLAGRR